jgi:hypothetical protein
MSAYLPWEFIDHDGRKGTAREIVIRGQKRVLAIYADGGISQLYYPADVRAYGIDRRGEDCHAPTGISNAVSTNTIQL